MNNNVKKEIVFIWFGDNEPDYALFTIDSFKKMNPTWEVTYIKYTTDLILNPSSVNDKLLVDAIDIAKHRGHRVDFTYISDKYRHLRISDLNYYCVYCDLDCFPIAPFDDFIIYNENLKNVQKNKYFKSIKSYGSFHSDTGYYSDIWCKANFWFKVPLFLLIHKDAHMNKPLIFDVHYPLYTDISNTETYIEHKKKFINKELKLGEHIINKNLSPIEHFFCRERKKNVNYFYDSNTYISLTHEDFINFILTLINKKYIDNTFKFNNSNLNYIDTYKFNQSKDNIIFQNTNNYIYYSSEKIKDKLMIIDFYSSLIKINPSAKLIVFCQFEELTLSEDKNIPSNNMIIIELLYIPRKLDNTWHMKESDLDALLKALNFDNTERIRQLKQSINFE